LIDIFQFAGDLYFFKAEPHGMSQLHGHPELNDHILSFMEPLYAARKREAAHSFKNAGRRHILDRLRLDFPLTYGFFYQPSGAHTEEIIGGINSILVSVLREYSLVTNVEIKLVNNARTALSEIIEQWGEMGELLNITRTLTLSYLEYRTTDLELLDILLGRHPNLKIVITWLAHETGDDHPDWITIDPQRVNIKKVVYAGDSNRELATRQAQALSSQPFEVLPRVKKYVLSLDTGEYELEDE
jgi:hypothetical protein